MTAPDPLVKVAAAVLADIDSLGEQLVQHIAETLPELADDPRLRDLLAHTVTDNLVSALHMFTDGSRDVPVGAPPVALEFARRLAQHGVPITLMLRAYRLGQADFQQEMITRIGGERPDVDEVVAASRELSAVAFTFIDRISEEVVAAYQHERDTWLRQRNAVRLAKVLDVLAGKLTDPHAIEVALGFRLTQQQVGAVLWCAPGVDETNQAATLERHLPKLAAALDCRTAPLSVAPDAATLWAWVPATEVDVDEVTKKLAGSSDQVRVALGEPARGLAGFRTTHRQACQAQTVALAAGPEQARPLITASQLGPLALLGPDLAAAAAWVQSVLGPLAEDDEQHAQMRETAWAYLSSGGSLSAAAAALHLHKNTIQYRIRKAEETRGRPFDDGRLDVEVALLACRLLGSAVLR